MKTRSLTVVPFCFIGMLLIPEFASGTSRFINISVDQIKDYGTQLIWQTRPDKRKMTFEDARRYCKNLLIDGMDQWRLPGIKELSTIVDEKSYNPSVYHYFKAESHFYWSATDNVADTSYAWLVNFSDSHIHSFSKTAQFHVRCVRKF